MDGLLIHIAQGGIEWVGQLEGDPLKDTMIKLKKACQVRRAQVSPGQFQVGMTMVGAEKDYASSDVIISSAGSVILYLNPLGDLARLWMKATSGLDLPMGITRPRG
jgi:hypothetical protein